MLNNITKSGFLKNSSMLAIGTGLAFGIAFLFQPFITRIYTPEQFGVFGIYSSVFGILVSISSFRYDAAIVVPENDEDGLVLTFISAGLGLIFSLLIFPVFYFFHDQLIDFLGLETSQNNSWLYFIPISVFLFSSYRAMNMWLTRLKKYKASSINKIIRRSSEGVIQLGLGKTGVHYGLIIGAILGDLLNNLSGIYQSKLLKQDLSVLTKMKVLQLMKKYKSFPIEGALPYFLNTISLLIPIIIFNRIYTEDITGQMGLSISVLGIPVSLISMSFGQVLRKDFAQKRNEGKSIFPFLNKISLLLLVLGVVGMVVIYFFSIPLFTLVFGDKWALAGELSSVLVFAVSIKFIVSPLSVIFASIERVKQGSVWQVFHFGAIMLLFLFDFKNEMDFVFKYVIIEVISYSIYYLVILKEVKKYERELV